jgi:hypothetical protein
MEDDEQVPDDSETQEETNDEVEDETGGEGSQTPQPAAAPVRSIQSS